MMRYVMVRRDDGTFDQQRIDSVRDIQLWLAAVQSLPDGDAITVSQAVRDLARSTAYHIKSQEEQLGSWRERQGQFHQAFREFCECNTGPDTDGPEEDCLLHGRYEVAAEALQQRVIEGAVRRAEETP